MRGLVVTEKAEAVRFWTTWFFTDWGCRKNQEVWELTGSGLGFAFRMCIPIQEVQKQSKLKG
jgi:hypothetical protein